MRLQLKIKAGAKFERRMRLILYQKNKLPNILQKVDGQKTYQTAKENATFVTEMSLHISSAIRKILAMVGSTEFALLYTG